MKRIKHIVVGTDFSAVADKAVDFAMDMAAQVGAQVSLVHAYELPMYSFPDSVMVSSPEAAQKITSDALAHLDAAIDKRKDLGISIKSVLRMGPPWEELNGVAVEGNADIIVVGTHGRRGFSRVMLGSVAERMVRTAVRPVVVVRDDEQGS